MKKLSLLLALSICILGCKKNETKTAVEGIYEGEYRYGDLSNYNTTKVKVAFTGDRFKVSFKDPTANSSGTFIIWENNYLITSNVAHSGVESVRFGGQYGCSLKKDSLILNSDIHTQYPTIHQYRLKRKLF